MDSNPQTFLIVQLGRFGDLILMTPMFQAIKNKFPDAKITVFCGRNNYSFLNNYPLVDDVIVHWKSVLRSIKLIHHIRKTAYDVWIDPKDHHSRESSFFAKQSAAKLKIGYNQDDAQIFDVPLQHHDLNENLIAAQRNMNALAHFALDRESNRPVLFLNQHSEAKLQSFLESENVSTYTHINISASKAARYWPDQKWSEFFSRTESNLLITADPADSNKAANLTKDFEHVRHYPTSSFDDVVSVVNSAKMVISPDTSIIHVAAAFNTPVIGLYSNRPWNLKKFYPQSDKSRVLINQNSDTFIGDISVDELVDNYHSLMMELK